LKTVKKLRKNAKSFDKLRTRRSKVVEKLRKKLKKSDDFSRIASRVLRTAKRDFLATDGHRLTQFLDTDCADYAEGFLVSFVYLTNFVTKASFVTKLCLRPQGRIKWPSYEAD
jgi:hypothetical protein